MNDPRTLLPGVLPSEDNLHIADRAEQQGLLREICSATVKTRLQGSGPVLTTVKAELGADICGKIRVISARFN